MRSVPSGVGVPGAVDMVPDVWWAAATGSAVTTLAAQPGRGRLWAHHDQTEATMPTPILRYFTYSHLREGRLRDVSAAVCELAEAMDAALPDGPEKSAGMRKLLEAKDCFVRSAL